jgi:hypothetical protein
VKKGFASDKPKTHPVVILDSNVWRFIYDKDGGGQLSRAAKEKGIEIAIAPAVMYEALRTKNPEVRAGLVSLMTLRNWTRVMPEAFEEAEELLGEIHRLAPQWLRRYPNTRHYRKLVNDWQRTSGGFWSRAKEQTDQLVQNLGRIEEPMLTAARLESKLIRKVVTSSNGQFAEPSLQQLVEKSLGSIDDPNIADKAWRLSSLYYFTHALSPGRSVHAEWLGLNVNLRKMLADPLWVPFWLNQVSAKNLPRAWIRYAMERLTPLAKINNGTPCDVQIATYCCSCNSFMTADELFAGFLEQCKSAAPFQFANIVYLDPGGNPFQDLLLTLPSISSIEG